MVFFCSLLLGVAGPAVVVGRVHEPVDGGYI